MKASELRIGNIIGWYEGGNEIYPVSVVYAHRDKIGVEINEITYIKNQEYQSFKQIPLTEEWLLKLGFEKTISDEWYHSKEDLFGVSNSGWSHIWDAAFTGAPCQHVHQLQNLYFALTGEELTIK